MMFSRSLAITPINKEGFKVETDSVIVYADTDSVVVEKKKGRPRKNEQDRKNSKEISNDENVGEIKNKTKRKYTRKTK